MGRVFGAGALVRAEGRGQRPVAGGDRRQHAGRAGSPTPRRPRTMSIGHPTATRIAFATKREGDEAAQIYILDLSPGGGEARRLTNLSTGASRPKWRPDGKAILFPVARLPRRARRRGEQENRGGAQGAQVQRACLRSFPGALLERMARRATADPPGAVARQRLGEGHSVGHGARAKSRLLRGRDRHAASRSRRSGARTAARSSSSRRPSAGTRRSRTSANICIACRATGGEPKPVSPTPGEYEELRFSADGKIAFLQIGSRRTRKSTTSPGSTEYRLARRRRGFAGHARF